VEWLAFHYFVLPLKSLIVLIDPASKMSPLPIFERWDGRMTIQVADWNFTGAVPAGMDPTSPVVLRHRGPQHKFIEHCMRAYKRQNWTSWIILTDTGTFY